MIKMITSKKNALIKEIKSLADKKFRDRLGVFVVEGVKPVKEAIDLNLEIRDVILTEKTSLLIGEGAYNREVVTDDVFDYVSEEATPQGALAVVFKKQNVIASPKGKCLLLDGVSDPANVGAIIRTAAPACPLYWTDWEADELFTTLWLSNFPGPLNAKA